MTQEITVRLQPGETIGQELARLVVLGGVQLAPGTYVVDNEYAAVTPPAVNPHHHGDQQ